LCDDSAILLGPLMVESRYAEVTLEAAVTDPNSTDNESDVSSVDALLVNPMPHQPDKFTLFDDGLKVIWRMDQRDYLGNEDCTFDTINNVCTCNKALYDIMSSDPTANDSVFTRRFAFALLNDKIHHTQEGLYIDCIAKDAQQMALVVRSLFYDTLDLRLRATDQSGNATVSPDHSISPSGIDNTLTCSGDPCACCLLLNRVNPGDDQANGGCRDLDGLMFDPTTTVCANGDPALYGKPCSEDADCDGTTGYGQCRVSSFGRVCPNGYCKSTRCLRP
jgi:hypothetical protein